MSAKAVVEALKTKGQTVACAESLTGGLVCDLIISVPGASSCMKGGAVCYQDSVKQRVLSVPESVIAQHTAVSAQTAFWMARGAQELFGSDYALSTTGYAGPDGENVGQVFICLYTKEKNEVRECRFSGDRLQIRKAAADEALRMLEGELLYGQESK